MINQKKQIYGFAVLIKGHRKSWWTQIYTFTPLREILRITNDAGQKPIAAIKIYLK
jgi:hypothetical protein